jgi:hypothetical protein
VLAKALDAVSSLRRFQPTFYSEVQLLQVRERAPLSTASDTSIVSPTCGASPVSHLTLTQAPISGPTTHPILTGVSTALKLRGCSDRAYRHGIQPRRLVGVRDGLRTSEDARFPDHCRPSSAIRGRVVGGVVWGFRAPLHQGVLLDFLVWVSLCLL